MNIVDKYFLESQADFFSKSNWYKSFLPGDLFKVKGSDMFYVIVKCIGAKSYKKSKNEMGMGMEYNVLCHKKDGSTKTQNIVFFDNEIIDDYILVRPDSLTSKDS